MRGEFEVFLDKVPLYSFVSRDKLGFKLTTFYADRKTIVDDILKVRVDEEVPDDLTPSVQDLVEPRNRAVSKFSVVRVKTSTGPGLPAQAPVLSFRQKGDLLKRSDAVIKSVPCAISPLAT